MRPIRSLLLVCFFPLVVGLAAAAPPSATWFPKAPPLAKPSGEVIEVSTVEELFAAAKNVSPGGTISVADGRYRMPRYFEIATDSVTLRGTSGDRHAVVLDGSTSRHGELLGITGCKGVTIADLTVENIKWNGIKINSDKGAQQVRIHNCVIHNIWQRGVKAPGIPKGKPASLAPRDCRIEFCLFYNDRAKRFSDDETDTAETYNGNYIGGIDVKDTIDWKITDNVFIGLQGRTREGRGAIYISENGQGCKIERNLFLDCDIGIALGNPSLGIAPVQAVGCSAMENLVVQCPETGILACHTKDCVIANNTVYEPVSKMRRLIWVQLENGGLQLSDNLLIGPDIQITSKSQIHKRGNVAVPEMPKSVPARAAQKTWPLGKITAWVSEQEVAKQKKTAEKADADLKVAVLSPEVIAQMRKVHAGFKGQKGYVAQFGDSITYSMAFWSPMSWDDPSKYLIGDDGLPKAPKNARWRDLIKGARDKGPKFANYSGWKVGKLLESVDAVLARERPEAAIIMIGTNDISGGKVPANYRAELEQVIKKCLAAHCVPVLNTIPPRRDREKVVAEINALIREVAKAQEIPLVDFHAEIIHRRPGKSWDGTIISKDGVHPSGGKNNVYDEDNLKVCGYALRNWVNFLMQRQLHFRVFEAE